MNGIPIKPIKLLTPTCSSNPTDSSSDASPLMLISPKKKFQKRNNKKYAPFFTSTTPPKRRHSLSANYRQHRKHRHTKSRFIVSPIGIIHDTDNIPEILIAGYNERGGSGSKSLSAQSTPYRVISNHHHHRSESVRIRSRSRSSKNSIAIMEIIKHLQKKSQSKEIQYFRNVSREVTISSKHSNNGIETRSPSNSISSTQSIKYDQLPLTPLISECDDDDKFIFQRSIGFKSKDNDIDIQQNEQNQREVIDIKEIEDSESRENLEKLSLFDMSLWNDMELKEWFKLIGEQDIIDILLIIKLNHII